MSKDIRSYFFGANGKKPAPVSEKPKSRKLVTISSDEEDKSPTKRRKPSDEEKKAKTSTKTHTKKRAIVSSDEEVDEEAERMKHKKTKVAAKSTSQAKEEKLQEVDINDVFTKKPVMRVNAPKLVRKAKEEPAKKKEPVVVTIPDFDDDDNFDETLNQLDTKQIEDEYLSSLNTDKSPFFKKSKESDEESKKNGKAEDHERDKVSLSKLASKDNGDSKNHKSSPKKTKSPEKKQVSKKHESEDEKKSDKQKKSPVEEKKSTVDKEKKSTVDKEKKKKHHPQLEIEKESKPHKNKSKSSDDNMDYNDLIEEKIDKKKQHAMLYQSYLSRGGARNPGSKEIPQGADNCLANLTFLITGVLDSLEREEAEEIIKKYGGKITSNVTKKLSYMIVGDQPGPSKMVKAENYKIKIISEDDFLDLLRTKPSVETNDASDTSHNKRKRESSVSAEKKSPENKKSKQESPVQDKHESPEKSKPSMENTLAKWKKKEEKKEESPVKKDETPAKTEVEKKSSPVKEPKSPVKKEKNKTPPREEAKVIKTETPVADVTNKQHDGVDHITALVEKYRPKDLKQIIGQGGDKSNAKKLHFWLRNWHNVHGKNAPKPKFNPKDDKGTMFKAALLSGPPGIGKTTTAYVVCADLGFEVIEFNASDTRSKRLLQEEIAGILKNRTVKSFLNAADTTKTAPKHVLLMDEVDGMAGNEDRGGMQELISFIKSTEIPIVCICNDRQSQKIKTLANYTFDLRFQKPRLEQIRAAMMSICFKEGIKTTPDELTRIIQSTNQDIRQVINHVAVLSAKSSLPGGQGHEYKYKNLRLGPWDVVRKVFSASEHKDMSIHDKSDLFFHDYSIAPLFVQENYPMVTPSGSLSRLQVLERLARCSESLAIGDVVERTIRNGQNWSLLPVQACFSSVIPGAEMSGFLNSMINFPSWLGRNSKTNKCDRMLQELTVHARTVTGVSKEAINLDYLKILTDSVMRPMVLEGTDGVEKAVEAMTSYHLSRDDLDALLELSKWPHTRDLMQAVESKTKAAFTRAINKVASYSSASVAPKKKSGRGEANDEQIEGGSDEEQASDREDEDNIDNDKLVKKAKPTKPSAKAGGSKTESKPKPKKPSTRGKKKAK